MKREIEFKAKDNHGDWCYGHLVYTLDGHYCITQDMEEEEFDICSSCYDGYSVVDEDTICQFTGIYDRENNKVFENDIVKISAHSNAFIVKWDKRYASFFLQSADYSEGHPLHSYEYLSVIGNIYDNPKLLKEE